MLCKIPFQMQPWIRLCGLREYKIIWDLDQNVTSGATREDLNSPVALENLAVGM